jgi:hypothetical protein
MNICIERETQPGFRLPAPPFGWPEGDNSSDLDTQVVKMMEHIP